MVSGPVLEFQGLGFSLYVHGGLLGVDDADLSGEGWDVVLEEAAVYIAHSPVLVDEARSAGCLEAQVRALLPGHPASAMDVAPFNPRVVRHKLYPAIFSLALLSSVKCILLKSGELSAWVLRGLQQGAPPRRGHHHEQSNQKAICVHLLICCPQVIKANEITIHWRQSVRS